MRILGKNRRFKALTVYDDKNAVKVSHDPNLNGIYSLSTVNYSPTSQIHYTLSIYNV